MNLKTILFSIVIITLFAGSVQAAITGATIVTNVSASDRITVSTNGTFNISFTESIGTNYTNISFASGFGLGGLVLQNITNNTVATSITNSGNWINITYPETPAGMLYFNFTSNVASPATSGAYALNITTNATNTTTTVKLCARDSTKPFFVKANNSVFTTTCGTPTETFGTTTTSISLTGSGASNFTFYAPNSSTQVNITSIYGATNATSIRSFYSSGTNPNNTIYVITNGTVTNPIITVSYETTLQGGNISTAIITAGVIGGATIIYLFRRRRH